MTAMQLPGARGPRRIVMVVPSLRPWGHDRYHAGRARIEAEALGLPVELLGAKLLPPALAAELKARPTFREMPEPDPATRNDPYARGFDDFEVASRRFVEDLGAADLGLANEDMVWLPSARMSDVAGLGIFLRAVRVRPFVTVCFHYPAPFGATLAPGTISGLIARLSLRSVTRALAPRVPLVTATNRGLAARLAPILGHEPAVPALLHWYDPLPGDEATLPEMPAGDGPLIGLLGRPRFDKGNAGVPAIVAAVRAAVPTARIVVQDYPDDGPVAPAYRKEAEAGLLRRLPWPLPDAAFVGIVRALDLLLLPYEPTPFTDRVSGPFCYASAHGRPTAVTDRTWMAGEIAAGRAAGIVFDGLVPATVAQAVADAVADLPALTARAAALAPPWRANDGARLIRQLLEHAAASA